MMTRIASLDTVRSLAAWGVAIPHFFIFHHLYAEEFEPLAILGVELFFILSGYVLAPQILQCVETRQRRRLTIFLSRRWMRTIPPYVVALIVATILFKGAWSIDLVRYLTYTQNLFTQHNKDDYYTIAWSLSVEEWFYIIFPIYLLASLAFVRPSKNAIIISAVSFIVFVSCARLAWGDNADWGPSVRRVVVFRVDSIAYGFLLYCYVAGPGVVLLQRVRLTVFAMLALTLGAVAFLITKAISAGTEWAEVIYPFLAAAFACSCLLVALKGDSGLTRSPLLRRASLPGGQISYSVYLFHIIFLTLIGSYFDENDLALQFSLYVSATGLFAVCFFRFFETPILQARPQYDVDPGSAAYVKGNGSASVFPAS
jgi:peptidoglycan/LPS O-acetylase OafA/YrhL